MDLLIKGFNNKEEIEEFITWYTEQGEQDYGTWLECIEKEGVRDFIQCDCKRTFPIKVEDNKATMFIME